MLPGGANTHAQRRASVVLFQLGIRTKRIGRKLDTWWRVRCTSMGTTFLGTILYLMDCHWLGHK